MAEKSRQIRQLPHRGHRINASKAPSRLQTGVTRLPYVVEMRRKILAVLKQFITSHHKYIDSQLFEE